MLWGLIVPGPCSFAIKVSFLVCVIAAGVVGEITAKRSILFVQALPGLIVFCWLF